MGNLPASQWPNKTAETWNGDQDGIDLFTERHNGIDQTAIYIRHTDGRRWPARTVDPTNLEHHESVVNAWKARGNVNDYR